MATATVNGGDKGVRVIVDADNEGSIEVGAGTSQEVSFNGVLEVRVLGIEVTGGPVNDNAPSN